MSTETIRVQKGDTFEVSLPEPAATGYRWQLAEVPAQVTLVDEQYEAPHPGEPLGSAGRRIATLRATHRGQYRLKFELARRLEAQAADEHWVEVEAV
jgi:predicted secreted protein